MDKKAKSPGKLNPFKGETDPRNRRRGCLRGVDGSYQPGTLQGGIAWVQRSGVTVCAESQKDKIEERLLRGDTGKSSLNEMAVGFGFPGWITLTMNSVYLVRRYRHR